MGYNLYIGEAEPVIYLEDRIARMGVKVVDGKEMGAPLNSSGDHSNFCYPSYGVWHNFSQQVNLYSLFYAPRCPNCAKNIGFRNCPSCNGHSIWWIPEGRGADQGQEGLIGQSHPGARALTREHLDAFRKAREEWLSKSPEVRLEGSAPDDDGNLVDWVLRRLDWLVWWTEWALANCTHPTFANS